MCIRDSERPKLVRVSGDFELYFVCIFCCAVCDGAEKLRPFVAVKSKTCHFILAHSLIFGFLSPASLTENLNDY